jgi:hypothetical protein
MTVAAQKINLLRYESMAGSQKFAIWISCCLFLLILSACGPVVTPTYFIPPFIPKITPATAQSISFFTPAVMTLPPPATLPPAQTSAAPQATSGAETPPAASPPPTSLPTSSPTSACSDALVYLADLNYPDGSIVTPGQSVEKQWRVQNQGSCNWDGRYRLKLLGGFPALGAPSEMALYPARAGAQVTLAIQFTAPREAGVYRTSWQAYNPAGSPFGDAIYMEIVVQP